MAGLKKELIKAVDLGDEFYSGLANPEEAAAYLDDVLKERGPKRKKHLLKALRDVARAHGFKKLAKGSESRRRMIYKALSENGNPSLETLFSILDDFGLRIEIHPMKKAV